MALIVETGSGLSNSESYVSVTEANSYHSVFTAGTTWSDASDANKERALRQATQYIDLKFGSVFRGRRLLSTQALEWPRFGVVDNDGFEISINTVPTKLRHATCELALRALSESLMTDGTPGDIQRTSVQLGPIKEEIEYSGPGQATQKEYPVVYALINPLTEGAKGVKEIERA